MAKQNPINPNQEWHAVKDTLVCTGSLSIQKWCVKRSDGSLVAVMLTKDVAMLLAASRELFEACGLQFKLIKEMSKYVGKMALPDYALFNNAPIKASLAIKKALGK